MAVVGHIAAAHDHGGNLTLSGQKTTFEDVS